MTYQKVMSELKKLGTAQNRKIYKRHGAGDKLYGVSFANLKNLKKNIKVDHALAKKLWASGNMDAQTLATMIADPAKITKAEADKWIKDIRYYLLAGMLADVVAKSSFAFPKMNQWMKSPKEYIRQGGYSLLCSLLRDGVKISDADCKKYLKTIEKEIHKSPNRARNVMNYAVMAIGIYKLEKEALASAKKIGKVEVDHGETSCKTPDAATYIKKARSRKRK